MHRGRRVVAFTPFGRERTVSILLKYMEREYARGTLDEWMLCMNTKPKQERDREYAAELAAKHPWIKLYTRPGYATPDLRNLVPDSWLDYEHDTVQLNTGRFYYYMQDRNAIYLRFDDDIVWVHPEAVVTLCDKVIDFAPKHIAIFPTIINNAISSFLLQKHGCIGHDWGTVGESAIDPIGWESAEFARKLHDHVLTLIEQGNIDKLFWEGEYELGWRQQFSVSCFAISGNEFADLDGVLDWDEEEHWLTMHRTGVIRKSNYVTGSVLVAHYTFFTHRREINKTDILDRYRALAENL